MKRNIARKMLVVVFAALVFVAMAATAQAQNPACSLALAAGKYGFTDSGTIVGVGPRAGAGVLKLDAAGNINGNVTASLNGGVTHTTLSGTYTLNPDCTGTTSFDEFDQSQNKILEATVDLVWEDNMREIRFIFTSASLPGGPSLAIVINGSARKQFSQSGNQQ